MNARQANGDRPDRRAGAGRASAPAELERQVERGSLFTHTVVSQNARRLREVESHLYGLMDVLLQKALISVPEAKAAVEHARRELDATDQVLVPGLALRMDDPADTEGAPVTVDCAARMHVCHAVCCRLDFALTAEEVESGAVKWDLGQPYVIRHDAGGFCVHNDRATGGCGVYEHRPVVCRRYSCAGDTRIWKDFEAMVLNDEWLAENLASGQRSRPRLISASMRGERVYPLPMVGDEAGGQ
jgi:Fe-S-cluster containining protein